MQKTYACVWSNKSAAEMVKFYKSIFRGSKVGKFSYWGKNPMGVKEGSVLTAHITILGQKLMLLNGYAEMEFNNSVSFIVPCKTQREIDNYWKKLTAGGGKHLHYDTTRLEAHKGVIEQTTSDILRLGKGTCQNFSVAFAAIARHLGIPTRITVGISLQSQMAISHAWVEVEAQHDKWIPFDPQEQGDEFNPSHYFPLYHESNDTYSDPFSRTEFASHYSIFVKNTGYQP